MTHVTPTDRERGELALHLSRMKAELQVLEKSSSGTILPIPNEVVEPHASGLTRRINYSYVPPSQERLDSQTVGGLQEQTKELRVDLEAVRSQVLRLTEMLQQVLAQRQS